MPQLPLRGYGPRVFISYSFEDLEIARKIEDSMRSQGFQPNREDGASLMHQRLTDAIPRRIGMAEVLVQVRTARANASDWIAREFRYATELKEKGHEIAVLPIVFDKSTLPDPVREWWYLDLERTGLTDEALDQIAASCLRSVHLLRLSEQDPFSVAEEDLGRLLEALPGDGKRVLADSEGRLQHWAQETLEHYGSNDSPHRDAFLAQERRRLDRLIVHQKIIDEVLRKLAVEVMRFMPDYTDEPLPRAHVPMRRFARVVLGDLVLQAASVSPPAPHALRTQFAGLIEQARAANTPGHSRGYMNPGFYAWAFEVEGGGEAMVRMGMNSPGFRGISVQIPRAVFGDMEEIYTKSAIPFDPRGELMQGTYLDYVLPQIAIHAAYNLTSPATVRRELDEKYAWELKQYANMGLD